MMDHNQKMAFVANMTDKALMHTARTPNVPTPTGGMSHEKMLQFVQQMTKSGLQHFDDGGGVNTTLGGPTTPGAQSNVAGGSFTGAIGNFLGTNNNYQAQGAPIQAGTNAAQLNNAYTGANNALETQAGVTNTLNAGLNQGANTQSNLTNQLTAESNGQGPNPALASLNQQTGQNIAQQAALAAGTRGAGANAGLLAAQNAQQGASTQQQAVGQAATQQAQQQLAAQNNLQNLAANQVAQGTSATQALNQAQQGEQGILQNANTATNNANVSSQENINNVNAGVASQNVNSNGNIVSGIGNALSNIPVIGSFLAKGGMVKMDKGGHVLDANARAHIAPHNFALPGGRYPIHDANHARNALARVSQNGTPEEKAKVRAAVHKKYPGIGKAKGGMIEADSASKSLNERAYETVKGGLNKVASPLVKALEPYDNYSPSWWGKDTSQASQKVPQMAKGGKIKEDSYLKKAANFVVPAVGGALIHHAVAGAVGSLFAGGGQVTGEQTSGPQSYLGQWLNNAGSVGTQGPGNAPMANIDTTGANPFGNIKHAPSASSLSSKDDGQASQFGSADAAFTEGTGTTMAGGAELGDLAGAAAVAYKGGLMKSGGNVPGKAKVNHDSLKNDTVPAMLSPGEVVIDKDTLNDKGAVGQMARAVAHHIAKRNRGGKA